ncbi:hypothetical protein GCM10011390_22150 [Aureimonas endophytica]|uniref:Sulfatase-modifying factor enzyme-like domain-containing protein n=1 Tax=Aureimonas endophytica TaxID=2027858 RepID=A0A916ZL04_9HYPH|nr:formylglycine-generating enzyme family protein [Aureimonas endophytica]GGE02843.1 hypothetical protein GCM10011390_22150 [Aureimonas endophytica]
MPVVHDNLPWMDTFMLRNGALPAIALWLTSVSLPALAEYAPPNGGSPAREGSAAADLGMHFVPVPAGTFLMGSRADDTEAFASELPGRQVTITRPFQIAAHEVTQSQWEAVMGSTAYSEARSNPYYDLPGMAARLTGPTHPVTVSWNDAQEFIRRLNEREGDGIYRLPTEAEWEYAARAGTQTAYSFGDDRRLLGKYAWFGEDFASGAHHPVGGKLPNAWGLHDVHGNVWEWVADRYGPYGTTSSAVNPSGPATGSQRVVRGGSWHETSTSWRSAFRKPYDPDYRGISIGFRLVRHSEP